MFANKAYCGVTRAKHSSHTDVTIDYSYIDYHSLARNISDLSRACSIRLLTKDAMVATVQQNVHAIMKMLFDEYQLSKHFLKYAQANRNKRLKAQGIFDISTIHIFDEDFVGYDNGRNCLAVTRSVWNDQRGIRTLEYFPVKVKLPPAEALYQKMITKGIDLNFVLHMFPRIIDLYEADFKIQAPSSPYLTKILNNLVKEFIWKSCQEKGEKVENPSLLTMKRLTKKFFKEGLNAQICTIKQGYTDHFYSRIISKPCTVYEKEAFVGIGYLKNSIKAIEIYKLPLCPSVKQAPFQGNLCYCIYAYNPVRCERMKVVDDSKKYKQETIASFFKSAMPLMRVPEDTVLVTYLYFSKENLFNLLNENQSLGTRETRCIDRGDQWNHNSRPASMVIMSDEQLRIFMTHFVNYLYTKKV